MSEKDFEVVAKIVALYEHRLPHEEEWISNDANAVDYMLEHAYPNYDHDKFFSEVYKLMEMLEPQGERA